MGDRHHIIPDTVDGGMERGLFGRFQILFPI